MFSKDRNPKPANDPQGIAPGGCFPQAFAPDTLSFSLNKGAQSGDIIKLLEQKFGAAVTQIAPKAKPGSNIERLYTVKVDPSKLQDALKELRAHKDIESADRVAIRRLH